MKKAESSKKPLLKKQNPGKQPASRYFVPDLSPEAHPEIPKFRPRFIFVAESPHINEVAPEKKEDRRPLCGAAGKQWWSLVGELLVGDSNSDTSLERLLGICSRHGLAVMNAVQYPLDPKITLKYPDADPLQVVGFSKIAGESSYKKRQNAEAVKKALDRLHARLLHPSVAEVPVYCLGNDAEWFVTQALGKDEAAIRVQGKIPHPSAWWRRDGFFGRVAREKLEAILRGSG